MYQYINGEGIWFCMSLTTLLVTLTVIQNFEVDVKDKASIYVPAIGKVTIVILLRNLLVSYYPSVTGEADLLPETCRE